MLAVRYIVENADTVKLAMKSRNMNLDAKIDELVMLDEKLRAMMTEQQTLKARQNSASKEIPRIKKEGGDASAILQEMKDISNKVGDISAEMEPISIRVQEIVSDIPNMPHTSVPVGTDESANVEVRSSGEVTKFDFEPKPHWDIGANLGILDPETAAKVTGSRFHFLKGLGARLERSIINFFLNTHVEQNGYSEVLPPFIVNRESMTGTGQLPKFEDDAFCLDGTDRSYFLVPTAEVPVTNMYRDEILDGENLPINYAAYSACFRAEAGSAGRDTRGLIRQHQFDKVELVKFVEPETSYDELEKLTADAEKLLQLLKLPYRVVCLCSGDIGFSSAKTYDIEVWMPSYGRYVEISSCSNFEDFQARRASIRYKKDKNSKTQLVHTLNGSGLAVGRTMAAILENYQLADGSVEVPDVLKSYMGTDIIK